LLYSEDLFGFKYILVNGSRNNLINLTLILKLTNREKAFIKR